MIHDDTSGLPPSLRAPQASYRASVVVPFGSAALIFCPPSFQLAKVIMRREARGLLPRAVVMGVLVTMLMGAQAFLPPTPRSAVPFKPGEGLGCRGGVR
jgi:hypothetical protein